MKGAVDQAGLAALIAKGLAQGYVTHDDIRALVPECASSDQSLTEIARLLDEEGVADVFMAEPSEEERKRGRLAIENETFNRGVRAVFREVD